MKTKSVFAIIALSAMLAASPAFAQRGGGSRSSGSHSSGSVSSGRSGGSVSSGRSGGSFSSPSSSRGSSFSSPSSRSSSRGSSYSSPSSRSSNRGSGSYSTPSSRSTSRGSGSYSTPSNRGGVSGRDVSTRGDASHRGGVTGRVENSSRGGSRTTVGTPSSRTPSGSVDRGSGNIRSGSTGTGVRRPGSDVSRQSPSGGGSSRVGGSPNGSPHGSGNGYARPGHHGNMPPSNRAMHPAPYFHHPYHHHMIHMRPIVWVPVPPRPLFWPGFWLYCNSYWYDYHVTDVTVVHKYVKDTYNVEMVSYVISGDIMYAIVNDSDGNTYLQVFDKNDKLLAEQEISRKYIKTEIDRENGGCWIFKKRDKDPMLFLYADGELLIYEAD